MPNLSLPSLEHARETLVVRKAPAWQFWNGSNLLAAEPESSQKLAALWLDAHLSVRLTRVSEEQLGPRTFSRLKNNTEEQNHIKRVIDAEPVSCTFCSMSPGKVLCGSCGGDGRLYAGSDENGQDQYVTCGGCEGKRTHECGSCDGTGASQRVEVMWVEDETKTLRYVYPPELPFDLQSELGAYVESVKEWPASLSMPLEEQLVSGPYRNAPPAEEAFQGFVIEGAIDKAREMVKRLCDEGRLLKAEVHTYALPLLYLRYPKVSVVVHHKVGGGMGLLVKRS